MKAYKTYADCPLEQNPTNIPSDIPWQVQECTVGQRSSLEAIGFTVVSNAAYEELVVAIQTTHASYFNSILTKIPDVTPRQIRIKLLMLGITETSIDNIINTLPSPQKESAMITWKYSTMFERRNPLVPVIAAMLSYTDAQIDQIWIDAKEL